MAQVSVTIAGRAYRMACEDGQEPHLEALARHLDGKIGDMRTAFGEIGDQRLIVMAAISIADELSEVKKGIAALEAKLASFEASQQQARDAQARGEAQIAEALTLAAQRVEDIAKGLNAAGRG